MSIQIMPSLFKANHQYSALSGRNNNGYSEFMRNTPGSVKTAYDIDNHAANHRSDIFSWDDEEFASLIESLSNQTISKDQEIDWEANGDSRLTQEQADYLREKYDIENMSAQDYYNLMADLTNMNLISGQDVIRQHARPIIIGTTVSMVVKEEDPACFQGNILEQAASRYKNAIDQLSMLDSVFFPAQEQKAAQKEALLDEKDLYKRLMELYHAIRR